MQFTTFDTLNYSRILQDAGIPQNQADAFTNAQKAALREILPIQELASKRDLTDVSFALNVNIDKVRSELKAEIQDVKTEIQEVRSELKAEIQEVRAELKTEIQDMKTEIQDVRTEIQEVRSEFKTEIAESKHEILKWVIGTIVAQTALIVAVIGLAVAFLIK